MPGWWSRLLAFLVEHLPPQMHLVIATREDPASAPRPFTRPGATQRAARRRLAFYPVEAAEFLSQVMSLDLSAEDIAALEARTEGWIAGLQLAALSMQGRQDAASFIKAFTGSHHFVLDFLIEEVLRQQSESVQTFLLRTSILSACARHFAKRSCDRRAQGRKTLELLEHANLFIIALDDERRWYRYHHLFADLLRQRLGQELSIRGDQHAASARQ